MIVTFFNPDGSRRILRVTTLDQRHEHEFVSKTVHDLRHDFQARTFKISQERKPKRKTEETI